MDRTPKAGHRRHLPLAAFSLSALNSWQTPYSDARVNDLDRSLAGLRSVTTTQGSFIGCASLHQCEADLQPHAPARYRSRSLFLFGCHNFRANWRRPVYVRRCATSWLSDRWICGIYHRS
jgi:hypothetical protein